MNNGGKVIYGNSRQCKSGLRLTLKFCVMESGDKLSKREEYERRTEELLAPIMESNNFELVDVEYVKEGSMYYLRAYIDKEGGITLDDCEIVNRALGELMDKHDFIDESYILEVSSPGLGRKLKKDRDFIRSLGKDIEIKLYKDIVLTENGKKIKAKEFVGRLDGYDKENIEVFLGEETISIALGDVALVRLAIDF